ncbi:MAG: Cna B-type domain-containing protein [Lachnospiraceae bacterium]
MMRIWMNGKCRTCLRLLLCLLLCVSLLPVTAFAEAEDTLDLTKKVNLTLQYEIEGAQFHLYKVAEVSQDLEFTLTGDFAGYPVEVNGLDSAGWRALAETLASFVERDGIKPLKTGVIGEQGTLTWSELESGLYLVLGEEMTSEQYKYSPMPSLIMLPSQSADGKWEYDPVMQIKYTEEEIPGSDTEMIAVMKVWQDHGFEEKRPEAITVELYMDGVLYDTVSLDKANNWSYEWESLPAGHKWTAMEKDIPACYTVTSVREDRYLVITNCYQPEEPSVPVTPDKPDKPGGGSLLPQTGQLWWPVPILALAGIVFFTVGWIRRKTQENGNE